VHSGIGLAQMALPPDTDPDARVGLEKAMRGVARLEQQIDVLLNVNRAEAGQELTDRQPLDPADLVADVIELMRPRAERRGIPLQTELPAEIPTVTGNRHVLAWALENLVDNAIKFSPAGEPVCVRVECRDEKLCLAVRDQGPGIDPAERARIFDKFYQADSSHKGKGSGLGLYFVKLAVEAHHGSIEVQSRPGAGSMFTLCLPVAQAGEGACPEIVEG
jgi:signal transduction histidine kinase